MQLSHEITESEAKHVFENEIDIIKELHPDSVPEVFNKLRGEVREFYGIE